MNDKLRDPGFKVSKQEPVERREDLPIRPVFQEPEIPTASS